MSKENIPVIRSEKQITLQHDDSDSHTGSESDALSFGGTYPRSAAGRGNYSSRVTLEMNSQSDSSDMSRNSSTERSLDDAVDWRERCHALEASLHKFKHRAAQIRELLAAKVNHKKIS